MALVSVGSNYKEAVMIVIAAIGLAGVIAIAAWKKRRPEPIPVREEEG